LEAIDLQQLCKKRMAIRPFDRWRLAIGLLPEICADLGGIQKRGQSAMPESRGTAAVFCWAKHSHTSVVGTAHPTR
jgi:hypothetical protein